MMSDEETMRSLRKSDELLAKFFRNTPQERKREEEEERKKVEERRKKVNEVLEGSRRFIAQREEIVEQKKRVLQQIKDLQWNRTFELMFPLQYLDIRIDWIRRTPLETLLQPLLPGLGTRPEKEGLPTL